MKLDRIKAIADAVLYEGYILYPYRPSSIKNRQRWTFGCLFPPAFAGRQGDAATMQTQLLLRAGANARLDVHVRFLQILTREVAALPQPLSAAPEPTDANVAFVARLEVDGKEFLAWEEAIERDVAVLDLGSAEIAQKPYRAAFAFAAARRIEPIQNRRHETAGLFIRCNDDIEGIIEIRAEPLSRDLSRLTVRIENTTALSDADCATRAAAQRRAFASVHTIVEVRDGSFVSLMDSPQALRAAAAQCDNQGTWPILIGDEGDSDAILSSPIILYDYPNIAPESPGDLYDATEIDEILTLRILAMTDAEKREMASTDARARALLERIHGLTAEELARMHGAMRPSASLRQVDDSLIGSGAAINKPRLASLMSGGLDLTVGAAVRLRPKPGGDIMDLALAGKVGIVEAIERDFEDRVHIAVTLQDDPGRDLGAAGFPGHRFYFSQEEIEPLGVGEAL